MNAVISIIALLLLFVLSGLGAYGFYKAIKYFTDKYSKKASEISEKTTSFITKIAVYAGIILLVLVFIYIIVRLIHFFWTTDPETMIDYLKNLGN
jgi:formate hydrogenlyase subunit 3/multisubunit Na+/H+ antiporter MnhD subunit